ncbi:hypothetical protein SDC9_151395 [bioreactor metagenome]|uniref:Uncharacterized protein n=1 Tax=bioreactor metagenome TaxID=1076179 RepID=A0A645ESI7_9ZZZZ
MGQKRLGDIGQGSYGYEGKFTRVGLCRLINALHGVLRLRLFRGGRQADAAKSRRAVDFGSIVQGAKQGACGTGINRDVRPPRRLGEAEQVI